MSPITALGFFCLLLHRSSLPSSYSCRTATFGLFSTSFFISPELSVIGFIINNQEGHIEEALFVILCGRTQQNNPYFPNRCVLSRKNKGPQALLKPNTQEWKEKSVCKPLPIILNNYYAARVRLLHFADVTEQQIITRYLSHTLHKNYNY